MIGHSACALGALVSGLSLTGCLGIADTESEGSGGIAGSSSVAHDSGWGLPLLDCDPAFELSQAPVVNQQPFTVWFTDDEAMTNITLSIAPVGEAGNWDGPVPSCTKCVWHWDVTGHPVGVLTLSVSADQLSQAKICQVHSISSSDVADAGSD